MQQPRIPIWFGTKGTSDRTLRRAARFDGLYPIEVTDDQVRRMLDVIAEVRGGLDGFSLALTSHPGVDLDDLEALGATWAMHAFWPGNRPDQVHPLPRQGATRLRAAPQRRARPGSVPEK